MKCMQTVLLSYRKPRSLYDKTLQRDAHDVQRRLLFIHEVPKKHEVRRNPIEKQIEKFLSKTFLKTVQKFDKDFTGLIL